ncbi:leucine-rich repeat-containing protein 74A-like [Vanessa tameamea]|uniref:Leucine-rich repeat-containing protein 74A-like n=1 Tax=Vanessa tameamea TaxID=334116 RepID=A0ABM4AK55_VANTA
MSSEVSEEEQETEVIYELAIEESSEEPPMEEWSSLIIEVPEENPKRVLYEQGLYSPGSGEVCNKYVSMSRSSILIHPYFNYPAVLDPGIRTALLDPEEKVIYADDGQQLYLTLCNEMNQSPVMTFYKDLLNECIDLKYYCVNPFGVRPMSLALQYNKNVTSFNLTDNFLNDDACFHLGEMLISNSILKELNLTGCRIGATGAKQLFAGLHLNRGLQILNINKNRIGDIGLEYLAASIIRGISVKELLINYNNISGKSANVLAEALETHNKFTHLDLSWNNLFAPVLGTINLLTRLSENKLLQELNLSWNSLSGGRIGTALNMISRASNLRVFNLSNNRLTGEGIQNAIANIGRAKKLVTLNLSYNPLTPEDAIIMLNKMKLNSVKIQNLLMDNVFVDGHFLMLLKLIKENKTKKNVVITYGGVIGGFRPIGPDMRDLVLNRVEFLTTKGKKRKVDIALVAMQMLKDKIAVMTAKNFADIIAETGANLDDNLVDEIINAFPGPKSAKSKTISIKLLVDYIQRKWPDRKLPPTPPPEPEPESPIPEPTPEITENKGKEK